MLENYLLAQETTFRIGGPARYFERVSTVEEINTALDFTRENNLKILVLGGGSNMLISDKGFDGLVIKFIGKGINVLKKENDSVYLKISAGEVWDGVVGFAVENNFWGIENLSHIPGLSGALAVQNVGAYGQEASEVVETVEAFDLETRTVRNFSNPECGFKYRSSVFNGDLKGKYLILNMVLKLSLIPKPRLDYPDLKKNFEGITPGLAEIRALIEKIRDAKFPYPYYENSKGNAGSFFKNSVLSPGEYQELENNFSKNFPEHLARLQEIKNKFAQTKGIKIPSAFLLEVCGLKNLQVGGAKINDTQPLVILNETGAATAQDVLDLAHKVLNTVKEKTGLSLQIEPELIGF